MSSRKQLFEQFFKSNHQGLVSYVYLKSKDIELAKEIAQEVFLKIWKKEDFNFSDPAAKGYLFISAKNTFINSQKKVGLNLVGQEILPEDKVEHNTPADQMELDELKSDIYQAIAELPEKCQRIFKLSRFEGLSYKEIAAKTDVSQKTVENQIGIALKKLRAHLK